MTDVCQRIPDAIAAFSSRPLADAALGLFDVLGYPEDWKKLPIPDVDAKAQAPIVALVDRILAAHRADVSDPESQVDGAIRTLYGRAENVWNTKESRI
jgi:hypothetical protein